VTPKGDAKAPAEAAPEMVEGMVRQVARLQELAKELAKVQRFAIYWRSAPGTAAALHTIIFGSRADADVRARQVEEMSGGAAEVVEVTWGGQPPKTID
jgi:hypothetical protein